VTLTGACEKPPTGAELNPLTGLLFIPPTAFGVNPPTIPELNPPTAGDAVTGWFGVNPVTIPGVVVGAMGAVGGRTAVDPVVCANSGEADRVAATEQTEIRNFIKPPLHKIVCNPTKST
jgi:hypothetical protein